MIFVTVGTQAPFERLVETVDEWAGRTGRNDVFAQIGSVSEPPRHIRWVRSLTPSECREHIKQASTVVAHAGMGTIMSALEYGTPIVVMPRRAALHEQRNDHQADTAKRLAELGRVVVAFDEQELASILLQIDRLAAPAKAESPDRQSLIEALRAFVTGSTVRIAQEPRSRGPRRHREHREPMS